MGLSEEKRKRTNGRENQNQLSVIGVTNMFHPPDPQKQSQAFDRNKTDTDL